MKPPTFIECSVCGREFGSKSIQIHEPQCLQKLRRTEIPPSDAHQSKPRRKKKLSPPFQPHGSSQQESNSAPLPSTPQQSFTVTMDSRKINLPKINHEGRHPRGYGESSSRNLARPSTATLAKPKILNIDYIQYDMSLTRIDFSSSSHSPSPVQGQNQNTMDENHNHKTTHRLTRQNTLVIDPANRSPFVLPAVSPSPTNMRSVLPTKLYKGVDVGPTKLPPSSNVVTSINAILGDPLKRTNTSGGMTDFVNDNFFSRQSGKLSIKAENKCLPCRNFVPFSSSSFWSSGVILMNMQLQSLHNPSFIPDLPCYIPADEFHLESPVSYVPPTTTSCTVSVSKSISFPYLHSMSSSQCLMKNDDTLLDKIPQIKPRTSCQPDKDEEITTVTSALAAANSKHNDSKVQDQSQAQRKCCGGHSSTCDYQTHLAPLQSFQASKEERPQIEGAAFSQNQHFERLECGSSQEIVFLKTGKECQNWSSDVNIPLELIQRKKSEDQYEFHQIFMGHMRYSNSSQALPQDNPIGLPQIGDHGNAICENFVSSAEEESIPANFYYEDDFEQESMPESSHDFQDSLKALLTKETVENVQRQEEILGQPEDIFPMVDFITSVTQKIPPLYGRVKSPSPLLKIFQPQTDDATKPLREFNGTTVVTNLTTQQGSGSDADDEESDSGCRSTIKWTSNWTLAEKSFASVNDEKKEKKIGTKSGVSSARDSVEYMKNLNYDINEQVGKSGRKLWNKNTEKNLDIADFHSIVINETSVSCSNKSDKKLSSISERVPIRVASDVGVTSVSQHQNEFEDVVVWEGSHCQHNNNFENTYAEDRRAPRPRQQSVPTRKIRHSCPGPVSKIKPRPPSREFSARKPKPNNDRVIKENEKQVISELVSAVYRLKTLQKGKILEDYLLGRPMTQGTWAYNRLGAPFAQMETAKRPQSSPSHFSTSPTPTTRYTTKLNNINRKKGANTCLFDNAVKLLQNTSLSSDPLDERHKQVTSNSNTGRPKTPVKTRKPPDPTMQKIEKIAKVYNVKPPFSAIATQTPRKGERLLTPTKDRKSLPGKVNIATQTVPKANPPKSALKKTDYGVSKDASAKRTEITLSSSLKKPYDDNMKNSEMQRRSFVRQSNESKSRSEDVSGNRSKPLRKKLTTFKKVSSCDRNSNGQANKVKKKSSYQHLTVNPELTIFRSENPSKAHINFVSELHHGMDSTSTTDNSFTSSTSPTEFSHYEGSENKKEFSHEVNVTADSNDVDICYRIYPPSSSRENKLSSHDKGENKRSDTVITLSARRIKSRDSTATLKKKSTHKDIPNRTKSEDALQTEKLAARQLIKSYSNIELIVPVPLILDTSPGAETDNEFVDLNIVVRRKSEHGNYPSLEKTKSGADSSKILLLLDENERKEVDKNSPSELRSATTQEKDILSWKQCLGFDFSKATQQAEELPREDKDSKPQSLKFFGHEFIPAETSKTPPTTESSSKTVQEIPKLDKVPTILYKCISQACQSISSDAFVMFAKQPKLSKNGVGTVIKEIYESSGHKLSNDQALQLIHSQNELKDFLCDYVPERDATLDTVVNGIAETLRFFGIIPGNNNKWAGLLTDKPNAE